MKLSVIIVCHNEGKIIRSALDSIELNGVDYEIIIVDNNSKDNLKNILKDYKIRLVENKKNLGFAKANNRGIRIAKGDYIVLMNPDVILEDNALSKLIAFMGKNKNVGAAGCKLLNKDRSLQHSCRRFPTAFSLLCKNTFLKHVFPGVVNRYLMKDYSHEIPRKVDWVSGALIMMRKEALDKIGLLDERLFMYFDDVDICRRIGKYSEVAYCPTAEAVHLGGYESKRNFKMFVFHIRSAMIYFMKNMVGKYD